MKSEVVKDLKSQLHVITNKLSKEKMKPVKNNNFIKPTGGLWTSTYHPIYGSEWVQYSMNIGGILLPDSEFWDGYLLIPHKNARLFIIDGYQDLKELMDNFKIEMKLRNPSFYSPREDFTIDFEKLQKEYDGIQLTKKGLAETKTTYPFNLDGWDVESTIWFRWVFKKAYPIRQKFSYKESLSHVAL
ncbi:hypothetical protein [Tepidibacillus fermentans]|nr:hypothetical protein [Tepidibacillus fermentans]